LATSISYENGNIFNPVIVLGDDPSNETEETDNVLIARLGTVVSVPRNTVSDKEGTPEADQGNES